MISTEDWLNGLLALLQGAQSGLLALLHALGLAGDSHGQPAWPFAWRIAGETLRIDLGQARQLALSLVLLAAAVLALLLTVVFWRRRVARVLLGGGALALLVLAPWPDAHVALAPADPTSFHRSPTGFTAASVVRGQALYTQHCLACHGADGRGQGPQAAALPVWPPDLAGPLLWRRADGDLFWRILHGLRDRRGATTMAGFDGQLRDDQVWSLIDYMKALGAGQGLRVAGLWAQPIGVPDFSVRCDGRAPRPASAWHGQRLRIVVAGAEPAAPVLEDPRLTTVLLRSGGTAPAGIDCVADAPEAWQALALVAGTSPQALAGTQFIADRAGWLRARGEPGKADWSASDLLCRTETSAAKAPAAPVADGMGALIARMDAEPVRFIKGGFVH
ncbi:cytochrome c [Xylophilus sp. GW821-FHT01B05]